MTRNFQVIAQLSALFGQIMMDPAAQFYEWSPALVKLLHAGIALVQAAMGVLAHNFNVDGSRSQ